MRKRSRFSLNTVYSVGAAIVIAGVGAKLLHLNASFNLISIGLGTEVIVFLILAFQRQPEEPDWSKVIESLQETKKSPEIIGSVQMNEAMKSAVNSVKEFETKINYTSDSVVYLGQKIDSLNGIYGNVLTAMQYKP